MIQRWRCAAMLLTLTSFAYAGSKGITPKNSADAYPAHAQVSGTGIGARLLSDGDARKALVSDVNRCCMVVEVALYPQKDKPMALAVSDFSLKLVQSGSETKASSGTVVAARLQREAIDTRDVSVSPHGSIGYQSGGYDPITGQRAPGPYTETGVSVARDPRGSHSGASAEDRSVMETELNEKGLHDGDVAAPVAGYVYFEVPRNKKATYQLVYEANGEPVTLELK